MVCVSHFLVKPLHVSACETLINWGLSHILRCFGVTLMCFIEMQAESCVTTSSVLSGLVRTVGLNPDPLSSHLFPQFSLIYLNLSGCWHSFLFLWGLWFISLIRSQLFMTCQLWGSWHVILCQSRCLYWVLFEQSLHSVDLFWLPFLSLQFITISRYHPLIWI